MKSRASIFLVSLMLMFPIHIGPAYALGGSVNAKVGRAANLGPVRSACTGGDVISLSTLKAWMKSAPTLGKLKYGRKFRARSPSCGGKKLWMRKLYYTPSAKGQDVIRIKFPDAGIVVWRIKIR